MKILHPLLYDQNIVTTRGGDKKSYLDFNPLSRNWKPGKGSYLDSNPHGLSGKSGITQSKEDVLLQVIQQSLELCAYVV